MDGIIKRKTAFQCQYCSTWLPQHNSTNHLPDCICNMRLITMRKLSHHSHSTHPILRLQNMQQTRGNINKPQLLGLWAPKGTLTQIRLQIENNFAPVCLYWCHTSPPDLWTGSTVPQCGITYRSNPGHSVTLRVPVLSLRSVSPPPFFVELFLLFISRHVFFAHRSKFIAKVKTGTSSTSTWGSLIHTTWSVVSSAVTTTTCWFARNRTMEGERAISLRSA